MGKKLCKEVLKKGNLLSGLAFFSGTLCLTNMLMADL